MTLVPQQKTVEQASEKPGDGDRSPNYPSMSLREAVDKARAVWEHEKRAFVSTSALVQHWGYSPKSSGGRSVLAALNAFGLLEFRGSAAEREARLSQRAIAILHDPLNADGPLRDAALAPKLYRHLMLEKYPDDLPSDGALRSYLLVHKDFNDKTVDSAIKDFKETVAFAKADQAAKICADPDTKPRADPATEPNGDGVMTHTTPLAPPPAIAQMSAAQAGTKTETFALDKGEVVIRWPAKLTAEEFEDFEQWLDILKRKVKRCIQADEPFA